MEHKIFEKVMFNVCVWIQQAKLEREQNYSEESFWLRTVNLRENLTEDKFTHLYEVQVAINKIYSLALV